MKVERDCRPRDASLLRCNIAAPVDECRL